MKRKLLEVAHKVGYEVMRKAQVELSIMDLRDAPPITEEEVSEELARMHRDLETKWVGCGQCAGCRARQQLDPSLLN